MGARLEAGGGLAGWLFGRRTYDDLLAHWNAEGGPFKDSLNETPKYVVSSTLAAPLPWPNTTVLADGPEAVRAVKDSVAGALAVMGSGRLVGALAAAGLVDEYLLMVHPLVLGQGHRLFPDGLDLSLRLTGSTTASTGLVALVYEPVPVDGPAT